MPLPYQSGKANIQAVTGGPMLLPNFFPNYVSNDAHGATTLNVKSPSKLATDTPRVNATAAVTIGGTVTTSDVVSLTVTQAQLSGGAVTVSVTAGGGDTVTSLAEKLVTAFNTAMVGIPGIEASNLAGVITFTWGGPMGNFAVLSGGVTGAATETLTLNPVTGVFSGGTGPVFIADNFNFSYRNVTLSAYYGQGKLWDANLLAALAAADMPVV